jgi:3-dehydroquinate synthetase
MQPSQYPFSIHTDVVKQRLGISYPSKAIVKTDIRHQKRNLSMNDTRHALEIWHSFTGEWVHGNSIRYGISIRYNISAANNKF